MLKITLRQMEVFNAVATAGSTSAAAPQIGLSQSATSASLNELEQALGLALFDRVGRRLNLSGAGRELLPRVKAILDGVHAVESWSRSDVAGAADLRIGASTTIGNYLLPHVLSMYRQTLAQPWQSDWTAHVLVANTRDVTRQVASFDLDIGLIEGPCHEPELTVHPWLTDDLLIVASATAPCHAQWAASGISLEDMRQATWLLREQGSGTREAITQALEPHVGIPREGIQFANSEAIKRGVAEGLGISCLSRWVVADALASGQLVALRSALPALSRQLSVVMHRDKAVSPGLARFRAFLEDASLSQ